MSRLLGALLCGLLLSSPAWPAAGEPPAVLLANAFRESVDVSRYLVSEKLDGVRAVWDGQVLSFRSGRPIKAPEWFVAALPKQPLDGELWLGRGQFERLSGIVRREVPDNDGWREVRYMIFELPGAPGSFRERADRIRQLVAEANVPWLGEIGQVSAVDRAALQRQFDAVIRQGGEGLMLHRADAPYETGRSDVLLKMKPWQDAEAVVVGLQPGKGRHSGRMGALRVRTPEGREFWLGTGYSDAQRREPPPIGTTITYRYRDLTQSGLPRFASFLRVWEE